MSIISDLNDPTRTPISITVHDNVVKGKRVVRVAGDSTAFRLFAGVLNEMADAVESPDHLASKHGWSLGISPDGPARPIIDSNAMLSLDCDPIRPV